MADTLVLDGTWIGFEKGGRSADLIGVLSGNHFEGTGGDPEESYKGTYTIRKINDLYHIDLELEERY